MSLVLESQPYKVLATEKINCAQLRKNKLQALIKTISTLKN